MTDNEMLDEWARLQADVDAQPPMPYPTSEDEAESGFVWEYRRRILRLACLGAARRWTPIAEWTPPQRDNAWVDYYAYVWSDAGCVCAKWRDGEWWDGDRMLRVKAFMPLADMEPGEGETDG